MTRVVHCKKEDFDVYIGRPSIWGNPFKIENGCTREQSISKYKKYLLENFWLVEMAREQLKDKVLGCWCRPQACHGDLLVEICECKDLKEWREKR